MNRINRLFQQQGNSVLSVYFTAGFPKLDSTVAIIKQLSTAGASLIEIGMPFSDPLADGPTIQESSDIALKNGMSLSLLFDQLEHVRTQTEVPLVLMGYLNPVLQYGMEAFCIKAKACGIDGVILPDLPLQEYIGEYKQLFDKHDLKMIFLITPQTSEERIRQIDAATDGFIYMVTSSATTGQQLEASAGRHQYFSRIKGLGLKNPVMAGFGIRTSQDFQEVCTHVNGAIIGSGFIRELQQNPDDFEQVISPFIQSILR